MQKYRNFKNSLIVHEQNTKGVKREGVFLCDRTRVDFDKTFLANNLYKIGIKWIVFGVI